jgi:hypothetical protein
VIPPSATADQRATVHTLRPLIVGGPLVYLGTRQLQLFGHVSVRLTTLAISGEAYRNGQGYHADRIVAMCRGSELSVAGFVRFIAWLAGIRRLPSPTVVVWLAEYGQLLDGRRFVVREPVENAWLEVSAEPTELACDRCEETSRSTLFAKERTGLEVTADAVQFGWR